MSILITGGAGYIGSVLAWKLAEENEDIVIIDDLSHSSCDPRNLPGSFHKGSILDKSFLDSVFKQHNIDIVCHLGALADVPDSVKNPLKYFEVNISGTLNLLEKFSEYRIRRIIFSSTAAVYGDRGNKLYKESDLLRPINPYGKSKLYAENIIQDYSESNDLSSIIFRYFCVSGASKKAGENRNKETHLIPRVIDHFLGKSKEIIIYGDDFNSNDGSAIRDYVHVLDIVNAHMLGIQLLRDRDDNILVNLGSNEGYTVKEVIKSAENYFEKKPKILIGNKRPGDPGVLLADNKLAKELLSWVPNYSLENMIESTHFWRENQK